MQNGSSLHDVVKMLRGISRTCPGMLGGHECDASRQRSLWAWLVETKWQNRLPDLDIWAGDNFRCGRRSKSIVANLTVSHLPRASAFGCDFFSPLYQRASTVWRTWSNSDLDIVRKC